MDLKKRIVFIGFIFFFSLALIITNFLFLEFWYAKREGLQNGFHIHNTSYSFFLWASHISYTSCLMVCIWSGIEYFNLKKDENYKVNYELKVFAFIWIFITMCEGLPGLPFTMDSRLKVILQIFNPDYFSSSQWWFGIEGFIYSLIDFIQYVNIHSTLPILVLIYFIKTKKDTAPKSRKWNLMIINNLFMIIWFISVGSLTALGMDSPYSYINWTKDAEWGFWLQILFCLGFYIGSNCLTLIINKYYLPETKR